eukprot:gene21606-27966_t
MSSNVIDSISSGGDINSSHHDSALDSMGSINESLFDYESEAEDGIEMEKVRDIDQSDELNVNASYNYDSATTKGDSELRNANLPENCWIASDLPSTLQSSHQILNIGALRYAWSYVWLICSGDLLIVYAIVAYQTRCQKINSGIKLRMLRANQRWDIQTIRQSLERFQVERLTRRSNRNRFVRVLLAAPREAEDSIIAPRLHNELDTTKLPPYYRLCLMVQKELCNTFRILYVMRRIRISTPLSYLLAFSGIGQWFTEVGRNHWAIVMRKYIIFCLACLGIWSDETSKAYDIEDLVKKFTMRDPTEATMEFLMLTIASRVILLQALGTTTTLISIIVITTCEAPLFVFSPTLLKKIPPLLYFDSRNVAIDRERAELRGREVGEAELNNDIPVEEWVIKIRSLSIFLTESRLILFLYKLVSLFLTIMILKGYTISTGTLTLVLIAMLPYYVGSTLIPILYIGKRLNLMDEDFRVVFLSWLSRPYGYCRSAAVCMWPSNHPPSYAVHPLIQEEIGSEPSLELDGEEDSGDDISMPTEGIAALIDDSIHNDRESEEEYSIDIVFEDGSSAINDGSPLEVRDNSSHAEYSGVFVSEENDEHEHKYRDNSIHSIAREEEEEEEKDCEEDDDG